MDDDVNTMLAQIAMIRLDYYIFKYLNDSEEFSVEDLELAFEYIVDQISNKTFNILVKKLKTSEPRIYDALEISINKENIRRH